MLAATNRPDLLDPALLRPGRFDIQIELPLARPGRPAKRSSRSTSATGRWTADVTAAWLAEQTEGFSGAEIEAVCRRAMMATLPGRSGPKPLARRPENRKSGATTCKRPFGRSADMNESYYLYALTWADCLPEGLGPGVDPRFPAELIRYGQLAALASRVGWDDRDLARLQQGSADLAWMSSVALRHHEIVGTLARHAPLLPMRTGTPVPLPRFLDRQAVFLRSQRGRVPAGPGRPAEWAVKLYLAADGHQRPNAPYVAA